MIPPQIPASVDIEDVRAFLREVGLQPEDVQSLRVEYYGMHVTLLAKGDDGQRMAAGRDAAVHQIFVPFKGWESAGDDRATSKR